MARYRIDPSRSRVRIEATSTLHPIRGEAGGLKGFFEAADDGAGRLAGPAAGRLEVALDQLKSGNRIYDREMLRRADAGRYPTIVGELTALTPLEHGRYRLAGDLSFHGVTRAVEGEVAARVVDGRLEMTGSQVFDIRAFGLQPPRILMLRVHPEVTVHLELFADEEG